jgi:hypothetical protein
VERQRHEVWLVPLVCTILTSLPFALSLVLEATKPVHGFSWFPIGYNPKDFLAYAALIREAPVIPLFYDPFTTEPHEPRIILLFLWVLGLIYRATGIEPLLILELARLPSVFFFFFSLWRLLKAFFPSDGERRMAYVTIAFSGGIEPLLLLSKSLFQGKLQDLIAQNLWTAYGWNTFEMLHNPMWACGLGVMLWILRDVVCTQSQTSPRKAIYMSLLSLVLWFIHQYTALMLYAVMVSYFVWRFFSRKAIDTKILLALPAQWVLIGVISLWQMSDGVYSRVAKGFFGSQYILPIWYPVTFFALLYFAVKGFSLFDRQRRAFLLCYLLCVLALHSNPFINGYHFVYGAHIPLCLFATPTLVATFKNVKPLVLRATFGLLLFSNPIMVTFVNSMDVYDRYAVPSEFKEAIEILKSLPEGNVLCDPIIGNFVPALTQHKVYVGHWFLTPEYAQKSRRYIEAMQGKGVRELVRSENIRYIIAPLASLPVLSRDLQVETITSWQDIALLEVHREGR